MEPRSHQSLQAPGTLLLGLQMCGCAGCGAKDPSEALMPMGQVLPGPAPQLNSGHHCLSWKNSYAIHTPFLIHVFPEAQPRMVP